MRGRRRRGPPKSGEPQGQISLQIDPGLRYSVLATALGWIPAVLG